jgi:glucokinase
VATIGIDVGGTKVLGVVLDEAGIVRTEARTPTPPTADQLVASLLAVTTELRAGRSDVTGLGVGAPGLVDTDGVLIAAPNLPAINGLDLRSRLAAATGLPVEVDNDATCALRGEHASGAARGVDDAVLVTLGTGIGGGLLIGGHTVRGAHHFAGEIGHTVVEVDGLPCPCGRRGCWERYASGSGLGRMARDEAEAGRAPRLVTLAGGDPLLVRGEHVTTAAVEGDGPARAILDDFGRWVAVGIVNLILILDVATVVVGGGLVEAGDLLLDPVRRAVAERLPKAQQRPLVPIVPAQLGEHAGAIGAALLARQSSR